MKHATPTALARRAPLLARLRALPGLVERTPGSFYFKSKALLHFHEDGERLYADFKRRGATAFERLPIATDDDEAQLVSAIEAAAGVAA